jgi:pyruvate formate lyase activating enzyme
MRICGLQKLALVDYPGKLAATVFTGGCNLRCPFCHNAGLVLTPNESDNMENEVLEYLSRRKGLLDGVCITGGEPLLMPDLGDFLGRIREMGYAIKLDTNGSYPDRLAAMIDQGLVDMVAMDIKNAPAKYALTTGVPNLDMSPIYQSADLLMRGTLPYEFRTTLVKELHDEQDMQQIGEWIHPAKAYFLQSFVDSGDIIGSDLHAHDKETMTRLLQIAQQYVKNAALRGI